MLRDPSPMDEMIDETERRLLDLGAVAGTLSHDLQNLLLALRLEAESVSTLLQPDHPARDGMNGLLQSLWAMEALTGRWSELASFPRSTLHPTPTLREAVKLARQRGCDFEDEIEDRLPETRGNAAMLRLAVVHCLDNARVASEGRSPEVELRAMPSEKGVLIEILDRGPGLSEEMAERAVQLGATDRKDRAGLGLSIARRAARLAGGRFSIENRASGGVEVRFELSKVT